MFEHVRVKWPCMKLLIVVFSHTMTDGGGNERNGRISNIMNSLWSNNGNDDTLFDTFKLVYGIV